MKKSLPLFCIMAALAVAVPASAGWAPKDSCIRCHADKWNAWASSGHPYMLRTPEEAKSAGIPLPDGYTWSDISYVIGGHHRKVRYLDQDGYIITGTGPKRDIPGKNQFNLDTGRWVDYEAGQIVKYDCGSCHTTGYNPEGRQDNLDGVIGTWRYRGITCERCHRPGGNHVLSGGDKTKIVIERSVELCNKCHTQGERNKLYAADGFLQHRQQFNEQQARKMHRINCNDCHDPHLPARVGIKKDCRACHPGQDADYQGSVMQRAGVACKECHLPKMAKSAEAFGPHRADERSHLFFISLDPNARQFSSDGAYANPYITVEFACLSCHALKDRAWALKVGRGIHKAGK